MKVTFKRNGFTTEMRKELAEIYIKQGRVTAVKDEKPDNKPVQKPAPNAKGDKK